MISNEKGFLILFDKYLDEDYWDYIDELEEGEFHFNTHITPLSLTYIQKNLSFNSNN
ncbi:hypothetical protein [Staphylococcus epidermidis]|uniref:hypothetical protein n=1 Tax=Staphylococcus epidermidis TaxID=1282 RepID=UPI0016431B72|nr:hypothetical protein [Staphylococcus epidermidis]